MDPLGWTRGKNEWLLAESESTESKVGTMPFCSAIYIFSNIYLHLALCGSLKKKTDMIMKWLQCLGRLVEETSMQDGKMTETYLFINFQNTHLSSLCKI